MLNHTQAYPTNRVFSGSFHCAKDGETYLAEYQSEALDDNGKLYTCIWHFEVVKGREPACDNLPWHDDSNIESIAAI